MTVTDTDTIKVSKEFYLQRQEPSGELMAGGEGWCEIALMEKKMRKE